MATLPQLKGVLRTAAHQYILGNPIPPITGAALKGSNSTSECSKSTNHYNIKNLHSNNTIIFINLTLSSSTSLSLDSRDMFYSTKKTIQNSK
jgi:hypothetical protein